MARRKRKRSKRIYLKSYYSLDRVVQKINDRQLWINEDVQEDARIQFGWRISDIKNAYRKLQPKHFVRSAMSEKLFGVVLDYYIAIIDGEKIFTHFYIDNETDLLIINSFHKPNY
jgi:hypothetical protein